MTLVRCSAHTQLYRSVFLSRTILHLRANLRCKIQCSHPFFFCSTAPQTASWWCPPGRSWSRGSGRWFSHSGPEGYQVPGCQRLSSEHPAMAVPGMSLSSAQLGGPGSRSGYFHAAELLAHGLAFPLLQLQSWKISMRAGLWRASIYHFHPRITGNK